MTAETGVIFDLYEANNSSAKSIDFPRFSYLNYHRLEVYGLHFSGPRNQSRESFPPTSSLL